MKQLQLFRNFSRSEQAGGLLLLFATLVSLTLANSSISQLYSGLWHRQLFTQALEYWINDGLMSVFFLLAGLEIKRELYAGELAARRKAALPVIAAIGGMLLPAAIHFAFNYGTVAQKGVGIPMATDIAFSLAVLSLVGRKVPLSLKVFLTALAIIDDLGAILVIAFFYASETDWSYLLFSSLIFLLLLKMRKLHIHKAWPYLAMGLLLWYCMSRSGIHPSISGVILAFSIPPDTKEKPSLASRLQKSLHKPVAFLILPLFALCNTALHIPDTSLSMLLNANSVGIFLGLFIGKPLGIFMFSMIAIGSGLAVLPEGMRKQDLLWVGMLGGIGFTMSLFTTLLAFNDLDLLSGSKFAILLASFLSGIAGYCGLRKQYRNRKHGTGRERPAET